MAKGHQGTYTFIPPPPLPEFYATSKKDTVTTSSSSSSTSDIEAEAEAIEEVPNTVDGAYDGKPKGATLYPAPPVPPMKMPLAQARYAREIPPLAIYHICRVCLRPRSPRYHTEHPIPINGLPPPPPGICRQCRVTTIEETKRVAEVVTESQSNKIKIGFIQPFVRDEDIISNEEMNKINTQRYLERLAKEHRPHRNIAYRHVSVRDEREDPPPNRRTKVTFTRETAQGDEDEPLAKPSKSPPRKTHYTEKPDPKEQAEVSAKTVKSVELRKIDSSKASISTQASPSSTSSSSSTGLTVKGSTEVSKPAQPSCTGSEVRKIAREEIDRYRDDYWKSVQSDSNIRKIARDEVERYRQAERKLGAHPDPYAHGRMVPIQRRIEQQSDSAEPMPWSKPIKEEKVTVKAGAKERSDPLATKNETKSKKVEITAGRARSAPDKPLPAHSSSSSSTTVRDIAQKQNAKSKSRYQELQSKVQAAAAASKMSWEKSHAEAQPGESESETASLVSPDYWSSNSYATKSSSRDADRRYRVPKISKKVELPPDHASVPSQKPARASKPPARPIRPEPPLPSQVAEWDIETGRGEVWHTADDQVEPSESQALRTWSKAGKASEPHPWYDEWIVRTIDTRSSRDYETSGSGGTQVGSHAKKAHDSPNSREPGQPRMRPDPDLEMTYVPAARRDSQAAVRDFRAKKKKDPPYPEHDVLPTPMIIPTNKATEQISRSRPSRSDCITPDNDREYLYAERIVQPANRPIGRQPFNDHRPARHVEVEEVVEWRRTPKIPHGHEREHDLKDSRRHGRDRDRKKERSPPVPRSAPTLSNRDRPSGYDQKVYYSSYERKDDASGGVPQEQQVTMRTEARRDSNAPLGNSSKVEAMGDFKKPIRNEQPTSESSGKDQNREKKDPRVKFSNKIDISPTPPGSDASSPEIRRMHTEFRKVAQKGAEQVDGASRPERHGDRFAGYEDRGRARNRIADARHYHEEERWTIREQTRNIEDRAQSSRRAGERRYERREARPLARALSESPSRELLTSLKSDNDSQTPQNKLDGRGPYREPEKVTDSMRVEDGSPPGRLWNGCEVEGFTRW